MQQTNKNNTPFRRPNLKVPPSIIIIIAIVIVGLLSQRFWYYTIVEEQEIGVKFRAGRIFEVVGPGLHGDFGLFPQLQRISDQAIPFEVQDEELITRDKQRIGIRVTGDALRPNLSEAETILANWAEYRGIYLNDEVAITRVQSLAKQAMKVCIGDRSFDASIIGSSRDDLRTCIDDQLNELTRKIGLRIVNLVVPDVILSEEVQVALDAIVASRLETEKAAQDKLRADAEATSEQAKQEGEIRVEQSRLQEQTRQQIALAKLEQERVKAQLVVIEAQRINELAELETLRQKIEAEKINELLAAQKDLEINKALASAAQEKAKATVAENTALAVLYKSNPAYVQLLIAQANASALKPTDKLIIVPEGTTPNIVLPGTGIVPTVNTTTPNQ